MSLADQLTQRREATAQAVPTDTFATMNNVTKQLKDSGIEDAAPKVGEQFKSFSLPNQNGELRQLETLLANGPLVVTFYRGGWCPYCNLELAAYQAQLDAIKAAGATLVAITPELPDESLSTAEKNALSFEVLSDEGSNYARELGIMFTLSPELVPIYDKFGIDIEKYNGKGNFELPLAATFIIAKDGSVMHASVDADYTYRQEPAEIVALLKG